MNLQDSRRGGAGGPEGGAAGATGVACEVIALLEVLWERGRDAVSPAPVSSSQLRVLHILERDAGINLRTLAEVLGAAPPSVSRLCDRLEALGYLKRSASAVSRREVELRLTGPGRSYLRDLRARREEALVAAVAAMPAGAREALTYGLQEFRAAVEEGPLAMEDTAARPARSA
ncbi:MarR family transcriptional regulator [Streptomyces sp. NPDC004111]|uniref:MarR family transcriptional regulator n=1 Tax=Streptomyces sp. NPDC004111 TaxID=3364690 RepID=UPI00367E976F